MKKELAQILWASAGNRHVDVGPFMAPNEPRTQRETETETEAQRFLKQMKVCRDLDETPMGELSSRDLAKLKECAVLLLIDDAAEARRAWAH